MIRRDLLRRILYGGHPELSLSICIVGASIAAASDSGVCTLKPNQESSRASLRVAGAEEGARKKALPFAR